MIISNWAWGGRFESGEASCREPLRLLSRVPNWGSNAVNGDYAPSRARGKLTELCPLVICVHKVGK
jgi:hypothetical protein